MKTTLFSPYTCNLRAFASRVYAPGPLIAALGLVGLLLVLLMFTPSSHPDTRALWGGMAGSLAMFLCVGFTGKEHAGEETSENTDANKPEPPEEKETKELLAKDIACADMKLLGMEPLEDDSDIVFRFLGGYFRMSDTDRRMVRILYPRVYSAPMEEQNLLARIINRVNGAFPIIKLAATPEQDEECMTVHVVADILYTSRVTERISLLRQVLQICFDAQHALAVGMAAAAAQGELSQDDTKELQGELEDIGLN